MNLRNFGTFALASAMLVASPAVLAHAQTDSGAKQDMKAAGHETKDAAVDTGHGIKQGTKKVFHKTKHGVKKVGHKVKKTVDPHANSQDATHQ